MTTYKGIDVSKHNGNIDWGKVKKSNKVDFAILRAGYGREISQKDAKFESYYSEAKKNDIPVGVYWYSYATTVEDAKKEAQTCIAAIKGKKFEYPIYYDIEEEKTLKKGKSTVSAITKTFCEALEKAGYYVGIYSMKSALESYLTDEVKKAYTVWLAHVNVSKTTYSGTYDMWQYSWKGSINGINGDVDLDFCYKDFPSIIEKAGLNGFAKDTNTSTKTEKTETKTSSKKPTYKKGQVVRLVNANLYISESSTTPVSKLTGTYYIYDGEPCKKNRYRITSLRKFCGKTPASKYVTGYVAYTNFK